MKLTILQVGETPPTLRHRFPRFDRFFERMLAATGNGFRFESLPILDGAPFPDPETVEGVIITGSAAGVYDAHAWIAPLRAFIRDAYRAKTPLLGVCFGHQIVAEALGGEVRKSERGWGIGRHVYRVINGQDRIEGLAGEIAIAASHQDQVIVPPAEAEVFLSSVFTPNAGLVYGNGATITVQPHPEFDVAFSRALVELRRGNPLDDSFVDERLASLDAPVDNAALAASLARFLKAAERGGNRTGEPAAIPPGPRSRP